MRALSAITVSLVAGIFLIGTVHLGEASAGNQILCPSHSNIIHNPSTGNFAMSWGVGTTASGIGTMAVVFTPTKLLLGGGMVDLSRAQLEYWKLIIDELRAASEKRVRVQVFFNDQTKEITTLQVLYYQPC